MNNFDCQFDAQIFYNQKVYILQHTPTNDHKIKTVLKLFIITNRDLYFVI